MKKLFNILMTLFIFCSLFLGIKTIKGAGINLDMKLNGYGLLEETGGASYGIGYGISAKGGLNMKKNLQLTLQDVLNIVLGFAGTICLGFIVTGGVKLIFAKGSKKDYEDNFKLMATGAIAFLIILFAYAATRIILGFIGTITG